MIDAVKFEEQVKSAGGTMLPYWLLTDEAVKTDAAAKTDGNVLD